MELGVNLIDTADSYGPHVSEELIAEALYPYPQDLLIATKGGLTRTGPGPWPPDGSPEHLREACEGSLRRLRLDTIELYQQHRPDPKVPYERSIAALKELQDEGKIRHIGVSNVSVEQLETAREIVEVVSVQNRFNLTDRHSQDVLERCEELGIAFFPWAPIATGELAEPGGPLDRIASAHDASPGQVALAWLLARSAAIVPIPGTSSVEHLEENLGGGEASAHCGRARRARGRRKLGQEKGRALGARPFPDLYRSQVPIPTGPAPSGRRPSGPHPRCSG